MDDSYLIHYSKQYLVELLEKLKVMYADYGIKLNEKKTCIVPLRQGFTFLKTRFFITDTGKIIKKPCRSSITRERKKLKKTGGIIKERSIKQKRYKDQFYFLGWFYET